MDFKFSKLPILGELKSDDLKFFYYDVARFSELDSLIQLPNDELLKVTKKLGIKLIPLKQLTFKKNKYTPAKNEIIFTIQKKNKNGKVDLSCQTALLNHLRNSFSHYRIIYSIDSTSFLMEDCTTRGYTMRGLVEKDKLKELIIKLQEYNETETNQLLK